MEEVKEETVVTDTVAEEPVKQQPTEAEARVEAEALLSRLREGMDVYTGKTLLAAAIVAAEARVDELEKLNMSAVSDQLQWRKMVLREVLKYKAV